MNQNEKPAESGRSQKGEELSAIITTEAPSIPEISKLKDSLDSLFSDIDSAIESGNQTALSFYLAFLGMLLSLSFDLFNKACEMRRQYRIQGIEEAWENSFSYDKILVETYPFSTEPESVLFKRLLQVNLWFEYFQGYLRGIIKKVETVIILQELGVFDLVGLSDEEVKSGFEQKSDQIINYDTSLIHEKISNYYMDPFTWNNFNLIAFAEWILLMLDPKFRKDGFIFIESGVPFALPRIYGKEGWATGFGGSLIVPDLMGMTPKQKAEMWDYLLIEAKIYDNPNIGHEVRNEVFNLIMDLIPGDAKDHADVCGGRGDYLQFLLRQDRSATLNSQLFDISPNAVEYAREHGLDGEVANVDELIPLADNSVEVVTIIYAVQWLNTSAFQQVLRVLRPGGKLIFNVYPPMSEEANRYVKLLQTQDFSDVEMTAHPSEKRTHYIVSAHKPS